MLGAPEPRLLDAQLDLVPERHVPAVDAELDIHRLGRRHPRPQRPVDRRLELEGGDVRRRDRFDPDGAPDPRGARVPDPAAATLLPARLEAMRGVLDVDCELVGLRRVEPAEIEAEVGVAAGVAPDRRPVELDVRAPVDAAEVEEHVQAVPRLRDAQHVAVAEALVDLRAAPDAGERRLERERHANRLVPLARLEPDLPHAVEVEPPVAERARIHRSQAAAPGGSTRPTGSLASTTPPARGSGSPSTLTAHVRPPRENTSVPGGLSRHANAPR